MKLQVLGTGCPKCNRLAQNAAKAIEAAGVDGEVVKVEELAEIVRFGVMSTPALAIDGEVKSAGKVLSVEQIRQILEEA